MPGWLLDMIKQASFSGTLSCSSSWESERGAAKSVLLVQKKAEITTGANISRLPCLGANFLVLGAPAF